MKKNQSNEKIAHLEMIQGIISRFAATSLAIKGFSAALITTVISVIREYDYKLTIVLAVIALLLGLFDAKYLKLEREYRNLYVRVASKTDQIDFSMKIMESDKVVFCSAFFSWSVVLFYLFLALAPAVLMLIS